jgi:hypothetical protein
MNDAYTKDLQNLFKVLSYQSFSRQECLRVVFLEFYKGAYAEDIKV